MKRSILPIPLGTWANRAYLYGRWGRTVEAQQARAKFEGLASKLRPDQILPFAEAYLGTERQDHAFALLEKGIADHSLAPAGIKVDPIYDPLRADPRFKELLRRLGLAN